MREPWFAPTVEGAYRRRLSSLWPHRHEHPRMRELIRQTLGELRRAAHSQAETDA